MDVLGILIPVSLFLGLMGLGAFFWLLKRGQFDDPEGDANRILSDDYEDRPKNSEEFFVRQTLRFPAREKRPLADLVSGPEGLAGHVARAQPCAGALRACSSVMPANRAS
jgi:cbb3-type cytochrome oxidase maturation protein